MPISVPKILSVRTDDEIKEAIEALGRQLGTESLSQIVRSAVILARDRSIDLPAAITRRAFREGVIAGMALVKSNLESAFAEAMKEEP